ncbi:unnamed protein product, partial [Mesorhabditis spiculigera]
MTGKTCTTSATCSANETCAFRDSKNKVCCQKAMLACQDLCEAGTTRSTCSSSVAQCRNSVYYTLMQQQCPVTCGLCNTNPTTPCADKINPATGKSDCKDREALCTNSAWLSVMQEQCPKTCRFCE